MEAKGGGVVGGSARVHYPKFTDFWKYFVAVSEAGAGAAGGAVRDEILSDGGGGRPLLNVISSIFRIKPKILMGPGSCRGRKGGRRVVNDETYCRAVWLVF